jgi:hypothetical protein
MHKANDHAIAEAQYEMFFMLFLTLRKNQDVINEDHDKLVQLFHENLVHQVHEVSGGIGQTKRHH